MEKQALPFLSFYTTDEEAIQLHEKMLANFSLNLNETESTTAGNEGAHTPRDPQLRAFEYYITAVVTNIVIILGLIGNILAIAVLSRRNMRSSTNNFLRALAVWDSVILVSTALLMTLPISVPDIFMNILFPYSFCFVYPLALTAQTATIWLTVSFTVERYIAVCHPLKAASMCTIKRAKVVIALVSVGSAIYNITRWLERRLVWDAAVNRTTFEPTSLLHSETYIKIYYSWLYLPIMCFIPLMILAVMNTYLILAVKRSQQQRADMNVRQSRENNVTIMLVAVVAVFIVCQVPALVYNVAYAIDKLTVETGTAWAVLSVIRNFLVTLNSAINFLLYCAFGQKFRKIFMLTFCRCIVKDHYGPVSVTRVDTTAPQRYTKMIKCNAKSNDNLNHSTSTTHTIGTTSRSSQESTFTTHTDRGPHLHPPRPIHENSSSRDHKHSRPASKDPSVAAHKGSFNNNLKNDIKEEPTYNIELEQLLSESEQMCIYKVDVDKLNKTVK